MYRRDGEMIPFLVADRPISLSIIKGIALPSKGSIGIMSQAATTTDRFKSLFRGYPNSVDVIYPNGQPPDKQVRGQTIKMVDSGVFGKDGCTISYEELFCEYERMGTEFGIIIDVLRNSKATIASAKEAMKQYQKKLWSFKLVGVAQGETIDEYLRCYDRLVRIGYQHIAIGGLLQKHENTVRYVYIRSSDLMENVLRAVRERFNPSWLFVLGAFHPSRIPIFQEYRIWGSDYKGWLFNYAKKNEVLAAIRDGTIGRHRRVGLKELQEQEVQKLSEQELRFLLTRVFIERCVLPYVHRNGNG
jgi:hypothetical protein